MTVAREEPREKEHETHSPTDAELAELRANFDLLENLAKELDAIGLRATSAAENLRTIMSRARVAGGKSR